jgi:hypothetical protein
VTAEVLIRGGEMFPEKTPAFILGSSLHRSFLKIRGIYAGYSLSSQRRQTNYYFSRLQRRPAKPQPDFKLQ